MLKNWCALGNGASLEVYATPHSSNRDSGDVIQIEDGGK